MPPAHRPEPTMTWRETTKLASSLGVTGMARVQPGSLGALLLESGQIRPVWAVYDISPRRMHAQGTQKPGVAQLRQALGGGVPGPPIGLPARADCNPAGGRYHLPAGKPFFFKYLRSRRAIFFEPGQPVKRPQGGIDER